ncbi:MAG: restriction endonuclease subunit S [Planctomycetia bacterium]|nr:restriction endonuclease subunit S [Planctomycetia bacterium]
MKIGEIAEFVITGKTPPTKNANYFNGNVQWFTPPDIGLNKYLKKSIRTLTNKAVEDRSAVIFPSGTLLITCIGNIGRIGILCQNSSANQQITGIKFKDFIDVNYAFYWFVKNSYKLSQKANQAVVPILNNEGFRLEMLQTLSDISRNINKPIRV